MPLQELQQQALQLPETDRWQLVHALLQSLKSPSTNRSQPRNLSRLRGIAKVSNPEAEIAKTDRLN